jgi:type II secretory pathway component PulM
VSKELNDLLRTLPRQKAPEGFARDVLARLDRPRPRPVRRLALAGALATALVVGGVTWLAHSAGQRSLRAEIAALRDQHQQLENQLADLRLRMTEPKVVVGGNDRVDYVLDLERLSAGFEAADGQELIWVPRQSTGGSL